MNERTGLFIYIFPRVPTCMGDVPCCGLDLHVLDSQFLIEKLSFFLILRRTKPAKYHLTSTSRNIHCIVIHVLIVCPDTVTHDAVYTFFVLRKFQINHSV